MYVIRKLSEVAWPGVKERFFWREFALPVGPILIGILFALLADKYPWPTLIRGSLSAKVLYGSICGICSGWVYTRFRVYLRAFSDKKATSRTRAS